MKTVTRTIIATLLMVASAGALAHGRVHLGVQIGPYWGPWWMVPPPVYYSSPIVIEREEPVIIQPTVAPTEYWYYCRPTNTYYPYVKECSTNWEKVPAQPPRQ